MNYGKKRTHLFQSSTDHLKHCLQFVSALNIYSSYFARTCKKA